VNANETSDQRQHYTETRHDVGFLISKAITIKRPLTPGSHYYK